MQAKDPASKLIGGARNVLAWWLTARMPDRHAAFRESFLRRAVVTITLLGLLSFIASIWVFEDEWRPLSFPTLHIYALAMCIAAGSAVLRGRLTLASWLLVALVLIGAGGVMLLSRQNGSVAGVLLAGPIFCMAPIMAAMVLPHTLIIPISLVSTIGYALTQFAIPVGDFTVEGLRVDHTLVPVTLLLLFEGILLRQLRMEFDARLTEMQKSVTEIERARQQADIARQQVEADRLRAEDADRAKSQFLANISHELRTPLNAIIGYDEAMLAGMAGSFTEQQHGLLERIQYNARRLLTLINDVLDLSKIESGAQEVYWAPVDPTHVIRSTADSLRSLAEDKGIKLEIVTDVTTPPLVVSDVNKLEQIIVNLLSNAIKFTELGGIRIATCGLDGTAWQIVVADTGVGIPPEAQKTIFDPFRQVDGSLRRRHQGTGLGLSITKRLVEMLEGTISVVSAPGDGSTFIVRFPLHRDAVTSGETHERRA
jgi:signal transduction histidine kinase